MSRRNRGEESSLELLLDTICNTFGGVLFIAMLVALLLQTSKKNAVASLSSDALPQPAIRKSDLIRLATHADELVSEIAQLEKELSQVRDFVKRLATPEIQESLASLHLVQEKQRLLEQARVEILASISADHAAAATASAAAQQLTEGAKAAEASAAGAAASLKDAQEKNRSLLQSAIQLAKQQREKSVVQSTGKAPRERDTEKREFGLLLRYGRIYRTHIHTGIWRTVNTADFHVEKSLDGNKATAKPGAGISMSDEGAAASIAKLLGDYPATGWYPCIVVHPDSYDVFQSLKSTLVAKGYEYRVVATDKPVTDRGGAGRVQ